jgi:hypothetical protein
MPDNDERHTIRILSARGGTPSELARFLVDLESAYLALYAFDVWIDESRSWRRLARMSGISPLTALATPTTLGGLPMRGRRRLSIGRRRHEREA